MKRIILIALIIVVFALGALISSTKAQNPKYGVEKALPNVFYCPLSLRPPPNSSFENEILTLTTFSKDISGRLEATLGNGQVVSEPLKLKKYSYYAINLLALTKGSYIGNLTVSVSTAQLAIEPVIEFSTDTYVNVLCSRALSTRLVFSGISSSLTSDSFLTLYNPTDGSEVISANAISGYSIMSLTSLEGQVIGPRSALTVSLHSVIPDLSSFALEVYSLSGVFTGSLLEADPNASYFVPSASLASHECFFSLIKVGPGLNSQLNFLNPGANSAKFSLTEFGNQTKKTFYRSKISSKSFGFLNLNSFTNLTPTVVSALQCRLSSPTYVQEFVNVGSSSLIKGAYVLNSEEKFSKGCAPGVFSFLTGQFWITLFNPQGVSAKVVILTVSGQGEKSNLFSTKLDPYQVRQISLSVSNQDFGIVVSANKSITGEAEMDLLSPQSGLLNAPILPC